MARFFRISFIALFLSLIANNSYSHTQRQETQQMPKMFPQQQLQLLTNLNNANFDGKDELVTELNTLRDSAKNPYEISMVLLASATLGEEKRYETDHDRMVNALKVLDSKDSPSAWSDMNNHAWKAWLDGRLCLAEVIAKKIASPQSKKWLLSHLAFHEKSSNEDLAFYAWASGYRAALDRNEYAISKKEMEIAGLKLINIYKEEVKKDQAKEGQIPKTQAALSNAIWALVMNLSAAAYAKDKKVYKSIKNQLMLLTEKKSVTEALETGLLRTAASNDYPAWALAKVRVAAAIMEDNELYKSNGKALEKAIAKADGYERVLSTLEGKLAMLIAGEKLQAKQELDSSPGSAAATVRGSK